MNIVFHPLEELKIRLIIQCTCKLLHQLDTTRVKLLLLFSHSFFPLCFSAQMSFFIHECHQDTEIQMIINGNQNIFFHGCLDNRTFAKIEEKTMPWGKYNWGQIGTKIWSYWNTINRGFELQVIIIQLQNVYSEGRRPCMKIKSLVW